MRVKTSRASDVTSPPCDRITRLVYIFDFIVASGLLLYLWILPVYYGIPSNEVELLKSWGLYNLFKEFQIALFLLSTGLTFLVCWYLTNFSLKKSNEDTITNRGKKLILTIPIILVAISINVLVLLFIPSKIFYKCFSWVTVAIILGGALGRTFRIWTWKEKS